MGEPTTVEFAGQILYISEPSANHVRHFPNQISVSFDDLGDRLRYEITNHTLEKINYKTVIAALKGTHPNIISARINKNENKDYELIVSVAYEYLPEVIEKMVFSKNDIPAEESDQAAVRNMRICLKGLRDQLSSLGNVEVIAGEFDKNEVTEVFVPLNHKLTVITWDMTFENFNSGNIRPQMFYYNSATKERKNTGAVPEEGVTVQQTGSGVFTELRFLAELEDYDMVLLCLKGKFEGEYTVSCERVQAA